MKKNILASFLGILLCLAVIFCGISCRTAAAATGPDSDGTYTSAVYDTSNDSGRLTARYIGLKLEDGETYAGDCVIYTTPDGYVMMVDCGNHLSYQELIPVLDRLGIEKIDVFVMSHPHIDHIGSFSEIAGHVKIGKVYKNYLEYTSAVYKKGMATIAEQGLDTQILYEGDSFKLGEYVDVQVFWPYEGQVVDPSAAGDTNHSSIAMRITYGDSSFWTSGDLYIADEVILASKYGSRIQSDVVKMNHHGRETSNSRAFINALQPKIAVATKSEMSNIPVLNSYRAGGASVVFHTAIDGTVVVSTTGDGHYEVQSQYVREQKKLYGTPSEDGHYEI